jgi:hypothetical protein
MAHSSRYTVARWAVRENDWHPSMHACALELYGFIYNRNQNEAQSDVAVDHRGSEVVNRRLGSKLDSMGASTNADLPVQEIRISKGHSKSSSKSPCLEELFGSPAGLFGSPGSLDPRLSTCKSLLW